MGENSYEDLDINGKTIMTWVLKQYVFIFTFVLAYIVIDLFLNNETDALIIQIYSVIKLYMFQASSLPIIRGFVLYIRHW